MKQVVLSALFLAVFAAVCKFFGVHLLPEWLTDNPIGITDHAEQHRMNGEL